MAAGLLRLALLLGLTRGRALTDGLPGLGGVLPGHCSVSDGSNSEKCCGFSKCPTFVSKSTQGWWVGPFRCRVRRRPRPSLSIGRSVSERASERARESQSWRWCQSVEPIKGIINRERVRVSRERESGRSLVAKPWATFAQTRLPNHQKGRCFISRSRGSCVVDVRKGFRWSSMNFGEMLLGLNMFSRGWLGW